MRVCCTATADYRSNAVGRVELEVTPRGLAIALCGVSSFKPGYAPGPPVHASEVCVPWPGVYATRLGDEQLLVSVDASYLPLNRLLLGEFSERPPDPPAGSRGRALSLGLTAVGFSALGVGLSLLGALPHPRAMGTFGLAALAVAVVLGVIVWRARLGPKPPSHEVLGALCIELARYVPSHIKAEPAPPPPPSFKAVDLSSLLPRSATAIAITLAATTLAALIGGSAARPPRRVRSPAADVTPAEVSPAPAPREVTERHALSGPPSAATLEAKGERVSLEAESAAASSSPTGAAAPAAGAPCECERHESLPWQAPQPRLSPVIVAQRTRTHDGHQHTELELALVNDGDDDARRLTVSVVFFEERSGAAAGHWQTGERPLYFEGPLAPGHAVRWHVEGRGTSFDVIAPDLGVLAADGSDAAPAEAFVRLAGSGARAVRLHAARLLAFRGDARARDAALALRPSASDAEAAYLDRILESRHDAAAREVAACEVNLTRDAGQWRVDACLFNRSERPRPELGLRLLAFDAPLDRLRPGVREPALLAEHTTHVRASLPARSGRWLTFLAPLSLESGKTPRAVELVIEREENGQ